jgi:hypothetical protein
VSTTDDELRASFRRLADGFDLELERSLGEVTAKEESGRRRRRTAQAAMAAAAVVVVALAAWVVARNSSGREEPAPRPGVPNPFTVVRTIPSSSLSIGRVLRVAVAPDGHLFVTSKAGTVSEVTAAGDVLDTWGRPGNGPGELRLVGGAIAVGADGRVYVSDTDNRRVQVFSATGHYLAQLGGYGSGPGRLLRPTDIAVDVEGDVYVSDDDERTITRFAGSGAQVWRVGHGVTGDPDLNGHFHLTDVDASGNLVAANDDAGKVVWISPQGEKLDVFGSGVNGYRVEGTNRQEGDFPDGACDTSAGPGGLVYVVSCQDRSVPGHLVQVFDADHRLMGRWQDSPLATAPVFLADGTAVAVGSDGSIIELHVQLSGG